MSSSEKKIPDLYLEQFVLGELSVQKLEELRKQVKNDAELRGRIEQIKHSNCQFFKDECNLENRGEINRRLIKPLVVVEKNYGMTWQYASVGAVLVIVFFILPPVKPDLVKNDIENLIFEEPKNIRLKGIEPELHIYRKHNDYIEQVLHNQLAKEDDLLQIKYQGAGYQYGMIFSIDGRGEITLHFPSSRQESNKIQSQGEIALPFSYQLDDAPNFERFFLITSHKNFSVNKILERIRGIKTDLLMREEVSLELPKDTYQTSISLTKVEK